MARKKSVKKTEGQQETTGAMMQVMDSTNSQDAPEGTDFETLLNPENAMPTSNPYVMPVEETQENTEEGEVQTPPVEEGTVDAQPDNGVDWEERYKNLEKKIGEQGQELGTYRQFFDSYVKEDNSPQSQPPVSESDGEDVEAFNNEFFTNPRKVLKKTSQEMRDELKKEIMGDLTGMHKMQGAMDSLNKAHPDREQIVKSDDFRDFVMTNVPPAIAMQGDRDPETANYILNQYKTQKGLAGSSEAEVQQKIATKRKMVNNASSVESTPRQTEKPVFSRFELMAMMQTEPEKYARLQPQIQKAYQEGRVK